MPRNSPQLARVIEALSRLTRGKLSPLWVASLGALAVIYVVAAPRLNDSLGWNLPVLSDVADTVPADNLPKSEPPDEDGRDQVGHRYDVQLAEILNSNSRAVYQSPAGLRYGPGSRHGHRLKHLMAHARDQPNRPGRHGVFDATDPAEVVAVVDEAYRQALAGKRTTTEHEGDRTVYNVDLGRRVGFVGGESGNRRGRPPAEHLRIVVDGREFVTAFPY